MSDGEVEHPGSADSTHLLKALVLVVVVVVIAIFVLHRTGGSTATATASTTTTTLRTSGPSTTTTTVALLAPSQVTVQVLNGTGTGVLAGTETTRLQSSPGYATLPANDTTAVVKTSVIYCASGYYDEGLALASVVGLSKSAVRHRVPASAPLPSGVRGKADLVLVIGPDLAARV